MYATATSPAVRHATHSPVAMSMAVAHRVHAVAPVALVVVPTGHSWQSHRPGASLKNRRGQAVQAVASLYAAP